MLFTLDVSLEWQYYMTQYQKRQKVAQDFIFKRTLLNILNTELKWANKKKKNSK